VNNGYKGYLEDRRPNSQGDPYQIASQILKTISTVPTGAKAAPRAGRQSGDRLTIASLSDAGPCYSDHGDQHFGKVDMAASVSRTGKTKHEAR
jgi:hypothetical protein